MGGGDTKPEMEAAEASTAASAAAASSEATTPAMPVSLEVRPEYTLVAPCGPPGGVGPSRDQVMVMARIKASLEDDDDRRAPVTICAVIDRSESMKDNIQLVKQSLEFMIQQLRDEDQLSLLAFDHEVSTLLPITPMTLAGKERANQAFGKLKERGQTNLSGGLLAALQQFLVMKREPGEKARVESVLLFTDGKANRGIKDVKTIARGTSSVIAQIGRQVSVFTFGFSEEHEANMLQEIATAGNGLYYYVADVESIPDSFCDCLGGLLSVAAQNITLQVEGLNEHRISKPLTDFAVTSTGANSYTVKIPDIYNEESKDILVNVSLAMKGQFDLDNPRPLPTEVLQCRLAYFDVQSCKVCNVEQTACVEILPPAITAAEVDMAMVDMERLSVADSDVALQRLRQATNDALRDADRHATANDRVSANVRIDQCVQQIDASPFSQESFAQHQRKTLLTARAGISDTRAYSKHGSKHLQGMLHANVQQRSNTNPLFDFQGNDEVSAPIVGMPPPPPMMPTATRSEPASSHAALPPRAPKEFNPYRGKKKAAMMADYWTSKGRRGEEEE